MNFCGVLGPGFASNQISKRGKARKGKDKWVNWRNCKYLKIQFGEGSQGKTLEHVVQSDEDTAQPKPNQETIKPAINHVRLVLAHGKSCRGAEQKEVDSNDPERHRYGEGRWFITEIFRRTVV